MAVRQRNKMPAKLEPLDVEAGLAPTRLQSKKDIMNAIRQKTVQRELTGREIKRVDELKMYATRIGTGAEDGTEVTLRELEVTLNTTARRYNTLKLDADDKQSKLESLLDELHTLELENKSLAEQVGDNPETQLLARLHKEVKVVHEELKEKEYNRMAERPSPSAAAPSEESTQQCRPRPAC